MSVWVEHIGAARLYLGDNASVMPMLDRPDAIVSDPPYGQRHKTNVFEAGQRRDFRPTLPGQGAPATARRRRTAVFGGSGNVQVWPHEITNDDKPFDPAPWLQAADRVLLWGAHRFADRLPPGTWLVWDKVPTGKVRDQGDGEAAWLNDATPRPMRIHRLLWDGVCVGPAARAEVMAGQQRVHPTQKPVSLMRWCIEQARIPGGMILDPYMGAGSTGIAAVTMGFQFIGIECEPLYFETACRRIEAAQKQADLFIPSPTAARAG